MNFYFDETEVVFINCISLETEFAGHENRS